MVKHRWGRERTVWNWPSAQPRILIKLNYLLLKQERWLVLQLSIHSPLCGFFAPCLALSQTFITAPPYAWCGLSSPKTVSHDLSSQEDLVKLDVAKLTCGQTKRLKIVSLSPLQRPSELMYLIFDTCRHQHRGGQGEYCPTHVPSGDRYHRAKAAAENS